MKAVNLIPTDAPRGGAGSSRAPHGPGYVVLGVLSVALAFVTVYVLASNTISERTAKVAQLQAAITQEQAQVTRLNQYAQFARLAQTRAETVREIAATRFDWHGALSDLAKVVPANTSLQSLNASVAPGAGAGGGGGSGVAGGLRGAIAAPAFELTGCTSTQDDVARLLSRLRLINGVTRVTLGASQKADSAQPGVGVSSSAGSSAGTGCSANAPTFDLVVFFKPLPGAGASGATSLTPQPVSSTSTAGATSTTTTGASSTTTTGATSTTTTGASSTTTAGVSNTPTTGGSK